LRKRGLLIAVLVVLIAALAFLLYMYVGLIRRPQIVTGPGGVRMRHLFSIYGYGKDPSQLLSKPYDVATDKKGNIYISDTGNSRVLVFDDSGDFLFKFGTKGKKRGQFETPLGIAVGADGRIYVADRILNKVLIFNSKGKFIKEFKVMMPLVLAVANSKVYIATYGPIIIYDLEGNELAKWGRRGQKKGEFDFPGGIAVDKKGSVYLSDTNNLRLQALDKNGEVLWVLGSPAKDIMAKERRFGLPAGVALDEDRRIYLVDAFHFSLRILNRHGKEISELGGEPGQEEGQFYQAAGIAYLGKGTIAVADQFNNRVQVLEVTIPNK